MVTESEIEANAERREKLIKRICAIMQWPYKTGPVYGAFRQIGLGNATAISNEKLQEIITRLERGAER